ncbi:MAG: hypothetical protein ACJA0Y_001975 [Maricaulis maris]|jgi:hypothetical protein
MTVVKRGDAGHFVDLAQREIEAGLKRVTKRRVPQNPDHHIEKSLYMFNSQAPDDVTAKKGLRDHTQNELVRLIKDGAKIRYTRLFGRKW